MNKYAIINIEAIQKRIEDLKKDYDEKALANDRQLCSIIAGQLVAYKNILSQSTPLIPENINKILSTPLSSEEK